MRIIRFNNKGWRARFDDGFNEENVARATDAFAYIWADAHPGATVLVGYDTRFSGKRFAEVAGGVLSSYGLKAIVSDMPCPTPALGWSTARDPHAVGAIMLTASSASCEYGGISARAADGGPVSDEFYEAATQMVSSAPVNGRGVFVHGDMMESYLAALREQVDANLIGRFAPKIVVDPMYGSSRGYLVRLLQGLGCRVLQIHGEPEPDFGGLHPSPVEPWVDKCEQAVLRSESDLGLVLDGDGDRLALIDERGTYVTPHRMVPLIMEHLVRDRGSAGRVVATSSCSAYIRKQAARLRCPYTQVPMGFNRIHSEFVENDVMLGVEEFGGICMPAHFAERDGLLAALLAVELLAARGAKLSQLVAELESQVGEMHYIKRDIRLDAASIQAFRNVLPGLNLSNVCGKRVVWISHSDGLVVRFEDDSWVQLRPSRTDPLVRACAEAPDAGEAQRLTMAACDEALSQLPARRM
ncbi:MAG: phosphoglucomutase [Atopobiaceae bacterium]|nr:phosphoglucomutase [Atopobiaceae bacterium]